MNIFEIIKNLFSKENNGPGLLEDNRIEEGRQKDFKHSEILDTGILGSMIDWKEKEPFDWRKFPIKNQGNSSSCVFNAVTKVLGIENFLEEGEYIELSARDGYSQRFNIPQEGSFYYDAFDLATKKGFTLESLMKSNQLSESDMNSDKDRKTSYNQIARVFKAGGYVYFDKMDIEAIASVVSSGKGVVLGLKFNYDEWNDIPTIKTAYPQLGHAVAVVDYTLYQGKKALVIEDSWGIDRAIQGRRIITEDFLKQRGIFAGYFIQLRNDWRDNPKPIYDGTIKSLQNCMKSEGLFPTNIELVESLGPMTRKSVRDFQKKYGLNVGDGSVTEQVKEKLRELYK